MNKHLQGQQNYLTGLAAEAIVGSSYLERGFSKMEVRWRGKSGEIDLIVERDGELVFVEVKASRTFDQAVALLSQKQLSRVACAANEYLAVSGRGLDTPCRIDLALVDGLGRSRVIENITMD